MAPRSTNRDAAVLGRSAVSAVITRYAVSSPAGMFTAGATPRRDAIMIADTDMVSIA
jgi:hypothetical protein